MSLSLALVIEMEWRSKERGNQVRGTNGRAGSGANEARP